jgi:hypothetical protein
MRTACPIEKFDVRSDRWGSGNFGAGRGHHSDGSRKFHDGLDLVVKPGETVFSPIDGTVEKVDYPYGSDLSWKGIQIYNGNLRWEIWYMEPNNGLIDRYVYVGDPIGVAQDISRKYPPTKKIPYRMIDHIHNRVTLLQGMYLINGRWSQYEITLNPALFMGGI